MGSKKNEIATQAPKTGTKERTGFRTARSLYGWVSMTRQPILVEKCLGKTDGEWLFV